MNRYGAVGLVTANCVSMGLRSMYSLHYARSYFAKAGTKWSIGSLLSRVLPHVVVLVAFSASFFITSASRIHIYETDIASGKAWVIAGMKHIAVGGVCAVFTLSLALSRESDIRLALMKLLKSKGE